MSTKSTTSSRTQIDGSWFRSGESKRYPAHVLVDGANYTLVIDGNKRRSGLLSDLKVSDRVGNIARRVYWPDGSQFDTPDNDAIDDAVRAGKHSGAASLGLHTLERSWRFATIAVFVVVAFGFATYIWGLPFAAERIAHSLPKEAHETISTGAMATLDRFLFDASEVDSASQGEIRSRFTKLVEAIDAEEFDFKLNFRRMDGLPNAMALPDGNIIVTDALIELAENTDELDSVLLHEIGHVLERHGMQHAIQGATIAMAASLVFGDVSGINELVTAVPLFLMQNSYSRDSESEADAFAFDHMARLGIDPKHFAAIILKLTEEEVAPKDIDTDATVKTKVSEYLSTHPDSKRRAQVALERSRAYNAKQ